MLRKLFALAALFTLAGAPALAETTQAPLKELHWSFSGPTGMYDQGQLQRGFKVYTEVCSQCHSLNLVQFHDLGGPGGPFYNEKYKDPNQNPVVKAIAAGWSRQVPDIDPWKPAIRSTVRPPPPTCRPRRSRTMRGPRASNGGALPPDMSLLAAAREGGLNYIYSLITSYAGDARRDQEPAAGQVLQPDLPG